MTGVKYCNFGQLQDLLVKPLSKWLCRAKLPHMGGVGGFKRTCMGLFTEFANLPELDPVNSAYVEPCGRASFPA